MTETPHPWDCLPTETPKAYAAFLVLRVTLGARRSVREAARQHHSKTVAAGEISSVEDTTVTDVDGMVSQTPMGEPRTGSR